MQKFTLDFSIGGFGSEKHKIFNEGHVLIVEIDFFPINTIFQVPFDKFPKTMINKLYENLLSSVAFNP